jgi:leader peptidase (prepilin peptidase) / N-methyltransferase
MGVYIILFFLGLAGGSFLNVLSLRYTPGGQVFAWKAVGGRSRCPHCKRTLLWYELVPVVSFFALRGRCRTCKKGLSLQYPIVEVFSGLIFSLVPCFFSGVFVMEGAGYWVFSVLWIAALWVLLLISVIDLKHYLVPDILNIILAVLGVGAVLSKIFLGGFLITASPYFIKGYSLLISPLGGVVWNHLLGALAGGLFFFIIVFVTRGRAMGMGDVKLSAALGLLMGLPDVALMIFFAFLFGGIAGAVTIVLRKKTMKSMLPFAPFIALGVLITMFFGHPAIQWYFSAFGL